MKPSNWKSLKIIFNCTKHTKYISFTLHSLTIKAKFADSSKCWAWSGSKIYTSIAFLKGSFEKVNMIKIMQNSPSMQRLKQYPKFLAPVKRAYKIDRPPGAYAAVWLLSQVWGSVKQIQEHYTVINTNIERKIVNISLPISLNKCFGCSKEPSHGSFEYPQHMLWLRNKKISSLVCTLNP